MSLTFPNLISQSYSQDTLYPYFTVDDRFAIAGTSHQFLTWIKASTVYIEARAYNDLQGRVKRAFPNLDLLPPFTIDDTSSLTKIDTKVYSLYLKFYVTFLENLLVEIEMNVKTDKKEKAVVGVWTSLKACLKSQNLRPSIVKINNHLASLESTMINCDYYNSLQSLETAVLRTRNLTIKDSEGFQLRGLNLNNGLNTAFIAQFFATYPTFSQINKQWDPKRYSTYGFLCLTQSFIFSNQKKKAEHLIQKYGDIIQKNELLLGMVKAYIHKGEIETAEKTIERITDQTIKDRALRLICLSYLKEEQFQQNRTASSIQDPQQLQQVFTLALSIQDSKLQVGVLYYLFNNYISIADVKKAREIALICSEKPDQDINNLKKFYRQYLNQQMFQDALDIAMRIKDDRARTSAVNSIFEMHLKENRLAEAHEIAKLITDEYYRAKIVEAYLGKDQFDKAHEIAKLTTNNNYRRDIVKAYLRKDQFGKAHEMAKLITDDLYRIDVVKAYLKKDQFDKAHEIAKSMTNNYYRVSSVEAYLEKDQFDKAHEIAKLIIDEYYRIQIVKVYLEKDQLGKAHEIAKSITDDQWRINLIRVYLEKNRFEEADTIVKLLTNDSCRVSVIKAYLEKDRFKEAMSLAKLVTHDFYRFDVVEAYLKENRFEESQEIAKLITDDSYKIRLIVEGYLEKGRFNEAYEIAKLITSDLYKSVAVNKCLEIERFEEGKEIAKLIKNPIYNNNIVQKYLRKDKFTEAREILTFVKDVDDRSELLKQVCLGYLKMGNVVEAESTIKLMPFSLEKLYSVTVFSKEDVMKENASKAILTAWKLSSEFLFARLFLGPIAVINTLGICLYHWSCIIVAKAKKNVQTISLYVRQRFQTMIQVKS